MSKVVWPDTGSKWPVTFTYFGGNLVKAFLFDLHSSLLVCLCECVCSCVFVYAAVQEKNTIIFPGYDCQRKFNWVSE